MLRVLPDPIDIGDGLTSSVDWNVYGVWFAAIATLLGAIGTVTAVFVALGNAKKANDLAARAAETANAALLDSRNARDEATREKVREQARHIYAKISKVNAREGRLIAVNASSEPVYKVTLSQIWVRGGPPEAPKTGEESAVNTSLDPKDRRQLCTRVLDPGTSWLVVGWFDTAFPMGEFDVEIAFTDNAGTYWARRADGALERLEKSTFECFGLLGPPPNLLAQLNLK
jgi:hypothetical protein